MSGICEIFPEDPSCAVEEPVEEPVIDETPAEEEVDEVIDEAEEEEGEAEEGDAEPEMKTDFSASAATAVTDWNKLKDMSMTASLSAAWGNFSWFAAAAMWAGSSAMYAFRYRSDSKYYDSYKIGTDSNLYQLADQVRLYGGLGLGGILALTSLIATFGIAQSTNGLVWMYGYFGAAILSMVVGVIRFMAYDAGYTATTGTDLAKAASGAQVMAAAKKDMIEDSISSTALLMALWNNFEDVRYGIWNAKTDEEQMSSFGGWENSVGEKAMALAEARAAAGLTMGDAEAEEAVEEVEGEEAAEGEEEEAAEGEEEEDATIEE